MKTDFFESFRLTKNINEKYDYIILNWKTFVEKHKLSELEPPSPPVSMNIYSQQEEITCQNNT